MVGGVRYVRHSPLRVALVRRNPSPSSDVKQGETYRDYHYMYRVVDDPDSDERRLWDAVQF
jgi:hypothetical protein